MILSGVKVVEFAGLAPGPFAGVILADYGADVVKIERANRPSNLDRGKRSIALNLKKKGGVEIARKLCQRADVIIEPFRPGVMEKLGLGPDELLKLNPRLIYARLTGFGQSGEYSQMAGHDINYLAMSGLLSKLGRHGEKPTAPLNLIADFAGGGLMCAMGVLLALLERHKSGRGQVIDASMVDGCSYIGTWIYTTKDAPYIWPSEERGKNLLDTGSPFYDTYKTKDGRYMAVGALEPQFFQQLVKGLGLSDDADMPTQVELDRWPEMRKKFTEVFASKTQKEWCDVFDGIDACVTPIPTLNEAVEHSHNKTRKSFLTDANGQQEPSPAPRLLRTPGVDHVRPSPHYGQHNEAVLLELGYTKADIEQFSKDDIILKNKVQSLL
ncbi:alpha-methylacyl-CoA racemase-like [Ptychodera flava]|uniref:alpha-methylacyl-CoA racemase-like n=1 Tax=Ptychodera flava TaxID=63121 RepID=UPI003969FE7C